MAIWDLETLFPGGAAGSPAAFLLAGDVGKRGERPYAACSLRKGTSFMAGELREFPRTVS